MTRDISNELEKTISRLPQVDTYPFRSVLYEEGYDKEQAYLSVFGANVLLALHRAREAREHAISYRDFTVGAALMAFKLFPATMQIHAGVNIKPEQDSVINVHAEQLALQKIKDFGGDIITIVAVVGELQEDTQSGRLAETLHPCGLCREKLDASGLIDQQKSLIVSALPDLRTIEMYSFSALQAFHDSHDTSGIYSVTLPDLELLRPFTVSDTSTPYSLIDTPESDAEEEIWQREVELPLYHFRHTGQWPNSSQ
jgi:cytidine deaminase